MAKGWKEIPPGPGRPKGSHNKTTQNARAAIAGFVEGNVDRLTAWLDEMAKDDPKAAFAAFMSVVEYHIPKLARQEVQNLDKSGQPTDLSDQLLTWLANLDKDDTHG